MTAPIARALFQHGGRPMTLGEIAAAESNRDPSARAEPEPMADWLSQSELEDIEHDACADGLMIGFALGLCIGTPIAFGVFWWLA